MDALGIVYTQYWLQVECVTSFPKHLVLIKKNLCSNKTQLLDGVETFVLEVLNASDLDNQQSMFKLMMKSIAIACMAPPFDTNTLIKMWCLVTTFQVLVCNFPQYVKFVKVGMVQIVGSVENEHPFSMLAFVKSHLCHRLITHLPLVVRMFTQRFYILQNFMYA
jgi:hypothetical protein